MATITRNRKRAFYSSKTLVKYRQYASLDGVNDYIDCGTNLRYARGNNPFTLQGWLRLDSYATDYSYLVAMGGDSIGGQASLGVRSAGNVFMSRYSNPILNFTTIVPLHEWTNLAIAYSSGVCSLYINGAFKEALAVVFDVRVGKVRIGCHTGNLSFSNGDFVHVKIWDKALSEGEVYQSMSEDVPHQNLIGYWPLKIDASDVSGFNQHGIARNGVTFTQE